MATLVDGGSRKEFDGGAMREIVEGKGRCDLLPLKQIAYLLGSDPDCNKNLPIILKLIDSYIHYGKPNDLYRVLDFFIKEVYPDPFTAMIELGKHYADGAKKYADRNWEKGLPLHSLIDSAIRHYFKFLRGDKDEPHDRAFMWNIFGAIWTQENHPECIDLPFADDVKEIKLHLDDQAFKTALQAICDLGLSYPIFANEMHNCYPEQISSSCEGCKYEPLSMCTNICHRANDGHLTGYKSTLSEQTPGRGWPL